MDLSPGVRRVVFGLIVCGLVGLGAYLLGPGMHRSGQTGQHPRQTAASSPASGPGASSASRPAVTPSSTESPVAGQADIYQWLPFTQAGLNSAAAVVVSFGDAYGTFSYTQSANSYVAPMQSVTSGQLAGQIKAAYSVPGVVAARVAGKQVSVGSATIESIRAFGPSSLTFVVQVSQQLTQTTGHSQLSTVYAVTVTGNGTSWQVSAIELASVGNS
jgi:hypothetical protein